MTEIPVTARSGSYPIVVQRGLARNLGALLKERGHRLLVIADDNTAELTAAAIAEQAGAAMFAISPGEASKSFASLERACEAALAAGLDRDSLIVGVGGGVVGDLSGVVAATYMRGVPLVQIPTTLLAQVDSAIGGKAAVNLPHGKNLVGAFKAPEAVYVDPELLVTLPEREYKSGLAEIAKYSMISDERLFDSLLNNAARILQRDLELVTPIIERCCEIKAGVVSRDEREDGERAILNYGHTVGHALEAATGYSVMTHGEAISVGMTAAGRLGVAAGVTPAEVTSRQAELLQALGLPLAAPGAAAVDAVLAAMSHDKKSRGGALRWVFLEAVGRATAGHTAGGDAAREAVESVLSRGADE
jgi:3-dehydroquinate synthase